MRLSVGRIVRQLTIFFALPSGGLALGQALPTLPLTREVVIAGDNIDIYRLVGGRIGPTGTIYLSSVTGRELQVFDSNGEKRAMLGRNGSGPVRAIFRDGSMLVMASD